MDTHECFTFALHYLHVGELRDLCEELELPSNGRKKELIQRVAVFLETGEILKVVPIPRGSRKGANRPCSLEPDSYILYGVYKNDLKTRKFFKELIGEYFHFTAFGIDWINERWLEGNPPTYREFAELWKSEYARRKQEKVSPKQEWAYINFVQKYLVHNPKASRDEIMQKWEIERQKNVSFVRSYINS